MHFPRLTAVLVAGASLAALPDTVKPIEFGPFITNQIEFEGNPASYEFVRNNAYYLLDLGWIEPISEISGGLLKDTYFETDGYFYISPYQSALGTAFLLKPIRFVELGLSYNRLIFLNSLVTFTAPGAEMMDLELARPGNLENQDMEWAGADIFTYQASFTVDLGPGQIFVRGARELWDIDVPGKDFVYEYSNDLVIRPRDRINTLRTRVTLDLSRYSRSPSWSFSGLAAAHEYWRTDRTEQEKSLISAGITGFRLGRNPVRQKRGLDLSLGYWLEHPQLDSDDIARSWTLLAHWTWNVQFLKL